MSILYIEDEIEKKKKKQEIIDALESIGLTISDLPEIEENVKERFDKVKEYQEWVKERFFTEYELKESKVITPNFGKDPESE